MDDDVRTLTALLDARAGLAACPMRNPRRLWVIQQTDDRTVFLFAHGYARHLDVLL